MEKAKATEERILLAARKIFIRDGWDGARMDDIAREAEVNKALLHYYFRNKRKLFEEIFKDLKDQFFPKLHLIFDAESSILEKVEALADEYINMLHHNPFIPLFLINEVQKNPEQVGGHLAMPEQFFKTIMPVFIQQMATEVQAGKIRAVHPQHLILHTISMCVFPFLARPMLQRIMQADDPTYNEMLAQRREEIKDFLRAALKP